MSNQSKQQENIALEAGQKIGDLTCSFFHIFGNIVVVWGTRGACAVYHKESLEARKKPKIYQIDKTEIEEVFLPKNHQLIILKTADQFYYRDYNNLPIKNSEHWEDHYSDPILGGFFRKDGRGYWYDIEGNRMESTVFLQDDVLISLPGKTSKQSLVFRGAAIRMSTGKQLIQVGKLVFDLQLNLLQYFGEKITGIGSKNIQIDQDKKVQEVQLGLNQTGFIIESTLKPFLIHKTPISKHLRSEKKGTQRYEVFSSKQQEYVLHINSQEVVHCDNHLVSVDFDTYLKLGKLELVKCQHADHRHYMDLHKSSTFYLSDISNEPITHIDLKSIRINGEDIRNLAAGDQHFCYNETTQEMLRLNDGSLSPHAIQEVPALSKYLALADLGDRKVLFYKKTKQTVSFPDLEIDIEGIEENAKYKLLNATASNGEKIVLDARLGLDKLQVAFSGEQAIVEVFGKSYNVGSGVLQNARLKTLGGSQKRVIDLNEASLKTFRLPQDLTSFPDESTPSIFRDNPVIELDFLQPIIVAGATFFKGLFLPYDESPRNILIEEINKRPLHLEGANHRNELVTSFKSFSLDNNFHIGHHRMIGAHTLLEDGKEGEILFSIKKKKSWLAFKEDFLPIFKKVVLLENKADWNYLLFQLRLNSTENKYIVVEKSEPHRILVEKKKGKEAPKIFESTDILEDPEEEQTLLERIFKGKKGYLKEL